MVRKILKTAHRWTPVGNHRSAPTAVKTIEIFGKAVVVRPACRFLSGLASPAHASFAPELLQALSLAVPMFFWPQSLSAMVCA